jgi:hypothetical protein
MDTKGTNAIMKNGFNRIARSKSRKIQLIREINGRYRDMEVLERLIRRHQVEKTLMDCII